MTPARGACIVRARWSSSSRSSSGRGSRPRSSFPSPRTPPTTSASRATCSRVAASSPTRCGASARRRSSSRGRPSRSGCRCPTLLAAIPMAVARHDIRGRPGLARGRRARSSRSSPGGWPPTSREERGLPRRAGPHARARLGLTSAVYLPLVLHSALPDSTMPFARPRPERVSADGPHRRAIRAAHGSTDPRLIGLGRLLGPRRAHPQRGRLARAVVWVLVAWIGATDAPRTRVRLIVIAGVVALAVFAPWMLPQLGGVRQPAARARRMTNALSVTGFDIFAWNDPPTLARYLAVGPARLLEMRVDGHRPQPLQRAAAPGHARSRSSASLALPWQAAERGPPAAAPPQRPDVPGDQPGVPGGDDVGHVPARRRAGPGPARASAPCSRSTRASPGSAPPGLDPPGGLARARCSGSSAVCCSASSLLPSFGAARGARPTHVRRARHADGRGSAIRSTRRPGRSSPTSRSGSPRRQRDPGARPCPTNRRPTCWTSPPPFPGTR